VNKGLISSLIMAMIGFAFIISLVVQPGNDDDIIGVVFPLSISPHDAFVTITAAGGRPISSGLNERIFIVERTEMNGITASELGALFLFKAQGAWGCSSSKAQAAFTNDKGIS